MCLTINTKEKNCPYNNSNIRYKVVKAVNGNFFAPYRGTKYNKKSWNVFHLRNDFSPHDHGIHVLVNLQGALALANKSEGRSVKKVEVQGFLQRGTFNNKACETWAAFRFIN